jgi:hypothetical protein
MAGKANKLSKELTQAVAGKRIAWLMAILAAVMLFATVAQQAQKAHAIVPAAASLTIVAPDVQVLSSGFITVTAKDVNGAFVANGTSVTLNVTCGNLLDPILGTTSGPVQTTGTVSGVATFGYLAPATPCLVTMSASSGLLLKTATFNVGPVPAVAPTDPGVILPGGLLCFNYSGPTTTLANFAAFFAAGVDGINIQQPDGTYKSWFRIAPSAATATVLVNGDRVCAGGTPGSNVFA